MKRKSTKSWFYVFGIVIIYASGCLIGCYKNANDVQAKWIAALIDVVIFSTFILLTFLTPILQDTVANPTAQVADAEQPFSLSKTQLGIWIATIVSFYIYAVLWDHKTAGELNTAALMLMGISASTFAAGAVLDTSEIQQILVYGTTNCEMTANDRYPCLKIMEIILAGLSNETGITYKKILTPAEMSVQSSVKSYKAWANNSSYSRAVSYSDRYLSAVCKVGGEVINALQSQTESKNFQFGSQNNNSSCSLHKAKLPVSISTSHFKN